MARASSSRRRSREDRSDDEEEEEAALIKRVKRERVEGDGSDDIDEELQEERGADISALLAGADSEPDSDDEDEAEVAERMQRELQDDEGNLEAYHRAQAKKKRMEEFGRPSDAGVVKSLTVVNFMNHAHTTVDFSPKMNFLVGHNGSGKSALLTAITIALGGKAAITGRGNGLKDLIRKGCDKATISLTLNNSGTEAFKPDVYGENLVIERMLASNGTSQYRFRATRDGKTLASKRDELTQIVDHFAIIIDSPLTVLTQDAARTFLQNANDKTLYNFFLEGTSLERLMACYEKLAEIDANLRAILRTSEERLIERREEKADLNKRALASRRLVELQAKSKRLHMELAWAYVTDKENEVKEAQKNVATHEELLAETERRAAAFEEQSGPLKAQVDEMEKSLEDLKKSRVPLDKKKTKATEGYQNAKKALRREIAVIDDFNESIERYKRDIESLNKTIEDEEAGRTEEDPAQVAKRKKIAELEVLVKKLEREVPIREEAVVAREQALEKLRGEEGGLQAQYNEHHKEVENKRQLLGNLEHQAKNRMATFGTGLDHVFKEFDRAKWVHSRPLGPLGAHVQLEDPKYQETMSSLLGQLMCCFAVRCSQDKATLMDILKRCAATRGYRPGMGGHASIPPIIQHTGDLFDYSSGDMSRFGPTVLSKLKVDNAEVLRILIVQRGVERSFVAPDVPTGDRLLLDVLQRTTVGATVYTADRFQVTLKQGKENRGFSDMEPWRGNQLFTRDVRTAINEARPQLDTLVGLRTKMQEQLQKVTADIRSTETALAAARREATKVRNGRDEMQHRLTRTKGELETAEANVALEGLLDNRKNLETELGAVEGALQAHQQGLQSHKDTVNRFVDEMEECDRQLAELEPERANRAKALEGLLEQRHAADRQAKHWRSMKDRQLERLEAARAQLDQKQREATEWADTAREQCADRVETTRRSKVIEAEHKAATQAVQTAKERGTEDQATLLRKLQHVKDLLAKEESDVKGLAQYRGTLHRAIEDRRKWWNDLRHHSAIRVKTLFIVHTEQRGFDGRMDFDHIKRTLTLSIQTSTQNKSADPQWKLPKNLSGGERSFSTVALLLAMWDVTTCPIRCLDEWDVFLDLVNRKIAAKILIEGAMASDSKQFILITPQDMSGIPLGPGMKVVRLNDPERNQATLDFRPA